MVSARWLPWAAVCSLIVLVLLPHIERISYWVVALLINYAAEHDGGPLKLGGQPLGSGSYLTVCTSGSNCFAGIPLAARTFYFQSDRHFRRRNSELLLGRATIYPAAKTRTICPGSGLASATSTSARANRRRLRMERSVADVPAPQ